ncbi:sialate O-acetylesterase [Aestuariimicrobium soli]|uniref:sialate O-acetylesterase n=1 Tax=Aestuariimicrobium soli TaxID=2035834 RepID=UPI003EBAA7A1
MRRRHRPLAVPPWLLVVLVTALVVAVGVAGVLAQRLLQRTPDAPTTPLVTGADGRPTTACDAAAEAEGLVPMRVLDLPEHASWTTTPPAYAYDQVPQGFVPERVGYCLELGDKASSRWAFASMLPTGKESDLGMPIGVGAITRQSARDLTVASSDGSVPAVEHGSGWLEMWPNSYSALASRQVPGRYAGDEYPSDEVFDADDTPSGGEFGSFQVHSVDAAARTSATVLAVNGWAGRSSLDVGIGSAAGQDAGHTNPDWTFAQNAGEFSTRRLTFYAREASAVVETGPKPLQLFAREPGAAQVRTTIAGRVTGPSVRVRLATTRAGSTTVTDLPLSQGRFSSEVTIPVALAGTTFELRATSGAVERVVWRAEDVLAGDVILVEGQSNAVAARIKGTGHAAESRFVRSYGSQTWLTAASLADDQWNLGVADTLGNAGSIGQWAAEMGHRIVTEQKVPVAIINGGHGGKPIGFFQRSVDGAADPDTNYGRTILRLRGAGVQQKLSGVFWYQGEGDHDKASVHVAGFSQLVADWRDDLDGPRIYVHQVRASPCDDPAAIALREGQRELRGRLDVRLLSTNGLNAQIDCHFDFEGGYRVLGDWNYRVLAADLYGAPGQGVQAPDVAAAQLDRQNGRVVWLSLRDADTLTVDPGAERNFVIAGTVVTSVTFENGRLKLTAASDVAAGAEVRYLGHFGSGPWVRASGGPGLLAFAGVRVG